MNNQIQVKNYTKGMLIRDVAEQCFLSENPIEKMGVKRAMEITSGVYNALEAKVKELLGYATPGIEVAIKLFEGITLKGKHVDEIKRMNNLTGKMMTYKAHIEPKAQFSKGFRDSLIVQN